MRILLVTDSNQLAEKLAVLNPELEYCAIVTDKIEPAKEILAKVGLSKDLLCPLSELKSCVDKLNYDYALCVQEKFYDGQISRLQVCDVPTEKLVSFAQLPSASNSQTERHLRYWREHFQEFEIFATGTSYAETSIDIRQFKRKAINFATSSQDLYYNFQIAKHAILHKQGQNAIRYALIGLSPYSFHFDLSKTYVLKCRVLPYLIAFDDIHNFPVPIEIYKKLLREEWLAKKPSIQKVNINGVKSPKVMARPLVSNNGVRPWTGKYYPETHDENIKILDDYLALCEDNNVRPVMFMAPLTEKFMVNFNKQLLEEFYVLVEQACEKHSDAVFVDGYKWNGVTYSDFYDHQHVNLHGAAKFSAYLDKFIEELQ